MPNPISTDGLPEVPAKNFCIAPFQSTRQNAYGRTSPCAFGAGEWRLEQLTPMERWHSPQLNKLRQEFIDGKRPKECHRCWDEEDSGKLSLRQRQYEYFPKDYAEFIQPGLWMQGPKTAVFKSSNVCNLACRSCGGWDSNTFTEEGKYYAKTYNTFDEGKIHNRFIPLLPPKHIDFTQYKDIARNLEKIDFFGGEPFLNITQLDLLEFLSSSGLSKNITLFYSTNCTNKPTARLKRAWNNFKRVEISMSIDGLGTEFEYLRWPGKWQEATEVMDEILDLKNQLDCEMYYMAGLTVSVLNIYSIDTTYNWLKEKIGDVYINMVNSPSYLSLHIMPDSVKLAVKQHITNQEALGYLDIKTSNLLDWKQFIIWTKRQDLYRQQNFATVFPEFFKLIENDWNTISDLSEDNFHRMDFIK